MLCIFSRFPTIWHRVVFAAVVAVSAAVSAPAAQPSQVAPLRSSAGYVIVPDGEGSVSVYAEFIDPERGLGFRRTTLPPPGADLQPPALTGDEVWLSPVAVRRFSQDVVAAGSPEVEAAERWGVDLGNGRVQVYAFRDVSWTALGLVGGLVTLLAALAVGLVVTSRRLRQEREQREATALARRWQEAAREAERARLAREIHDGPLQDLHALRLRVALPAGGDGAPARCGLDEAAQAVALELRAIAEGLRPPALSRFGLGAALEAHARRVRQRREVQVSVTAVDDADRLSEDARTALFRIGQEAISNAIRHGDARAIEVRLWLEPSPDAPQSLRLTVADDGTGVEPLDAEALVSEGHFGLAGMRERAALLGGTFALEPQEDRGSLLAVTVPWASVAADAAAFARPAVLS